MPGSTPPSASPAPVAPEAEAGSPPAAAPSTAAAHVTPARPPRVAPRMPAITAQQLTTAYLGVTIGGATHVANEVDRARGITAEHITFLEGLVAKQTQTHETGRAMLDRTLHPENNHAMEFARFHERFSSLMDAFGGASLHTRKVVDGVYCTHELVLQILSIILRFNYTLSPSQSRKDVGKWRVRLYEAVYLEAFGGEITEGEKLEVPSTVSRVCLEILAAVVHEPHMDPRWGTREAATGG
jgi:hypothetical protein